MSKEIIQVTNENFQSEVMGSELPVVVDFWAPWCGPCKQIGPILDELAVTFAGKVKVAKVNVDEEPEIAGAFEVQGIPMLVGIRNQRIIEKAVGFRGRKPLEELFESLSAAS